jgi:1-acyl-sn-glycerol-3-phosphate acyltransferase
MVACGHVLAGHEMRVVDSNGRELPQRHEGRLQFKGPSATRGYLNNPEATRQLFDGDWLETGDRAYIADGDLYLAGRVKDMIIRGGRNIYPYELEQAVGSIEGIRKGCVAVFASPDQAAATETLVVVAETREREPQRLSELHERISRCSVDILGTPPDDIVLAPPHSVLKTSSGKIRRNAIRDLYQRAELGKSGHGMWWQLARVTLSSIGPQLRRWRRSAMTYLFAFYVWLLFGMLALIAWGGVMLLPKPAWRWGFCRKIGRLALRLSGTSLTVDGLQHLPPAGQPCIVAANHSSYLDALVLASALPRDFRFVAKRELGNSALLKPMLERLGVILVERFDIRQTSADTEKTLQAAQAGDSLAFFPEATFGRTPGLLPFRLGAFVAAARAQLPVIPVILQGTRTMLLENTWFPRRAALRVSVTPALEPDGSDWQAAVQLRDRVRAVMLATSGEPDLSHQDNPLLKKHSNRSGFD